MKPYQYPGARPLSASIFIEDLVGPMPQHKKELIEWLKGFRHTAGLIQMVEQYTLTPEQTERWRQQMETWLQPKASTLKEAHRARALS